MSNSTSIITALRQSASQQKEPNTREWMALAAIMKLNEHQTPEQHVEQYLKAFPWPKDVCEKKWQGRPIGALDTLYCLSSGFSMFNLEYYILGDLPLQKGLFVLKSYESFLLPKTVQELFEAHQDESYFKRNPQGHFNPLKTRAGLWVALWVQSLPMELRTALHDKSILDPERLARLHPELIQFTKEFLQEAQGVIQRIRAIIPVLERQLKEQKNR